LLSIAQVAKYCHVERSTVYRWIKIGQLNSAKGPSGSVRVKREELRKFLQEYDFTIPHELLTEEKPKILIVDDDIVSIKAMVTQLQHFGNWKIEFAEDGYEACIKAGSFGPDVMLLDIRMPKMSGIEVCRKIKSTPDTKNIHIVLITGYPEELENEELQSVVAASFLKPVDVLEVTQKISELLNLEISF
jgi:excisionase family DNA binding protein